MVGFGFGFILLNFLFVGKFWHVMLRYGVWGVFAKWDLMILGFLVM